MADETSQGSIDKLKDYVQTPQGRIVAIAGASGALLLVLLVIFLTIFMGGGGEPAKIVDTTDTPPAASAPTVDSGSSASNEDSIVSSDTAGDSFETYQTRDPFKPAIETTTTALTGAAVTGSGGETTTGTVSTTEEAAAAKTALSLVSVTNQSGINYAKIVYGGTEYNLKAGDRVGTSSYMVQQVNTSSAVLLFGDDQFTLQVGQEVFK